ncbi:MAG: indole-3-glycerol phosphate synthase TrpC [Pyrinomonadaceae bacterium]
MSDTFLDRIVSAKRVSVDRKKAVDGEDVKLRAREVRSHGAGKSLHQALSRPDRTNIIAEIKRASPSKGIINAEIDIVTLAQSYSRGGAAAISVLTEEQFFNGTLNDLIAAGNAVDLPILRKDFIIDEFQIYESAAAGADAILLIVAVLTENELNDFHRIARNELGLDVVVEVHDAKELTAAVACGAFIIGVNNRDLRSFAVSLDVSRQLIGSRPANALIIAESGITSRAQIDELRALGFDGFLVGETLMRSGDAEYVLARWV